jgi:hypothetical protein
MAKVITICAWCDLLMSVKVTDQVLTPVMTSHGICPNCLEKITKEDVELCKTIVRLCDQDT